ncbi:unnamed protein product [Hymenolepis diminuta]|uniref:I-set domain-containing protein n=1 Tax=Hymenolepis diminuta TaxID=6216 RepID=A0A0R3SDI3_HYMDI|nr:unnamed protein product [Hymenolepis diminuta]
MYFRQILLLILLIVSLSPYPNNARYPRATDDMKVQKAPDTIPELNGHIPDYISFDAAAPIIDNSEEDEEDEEGLEDMETEGSSGVDHNFLSPEFNPEHVAFAPKPMSPTNGGKCIVQVDITAFPESNNHGGCAFYMCLRRHTTTGALVYYSFLTLTPSFIFPLLGFIKLQEEMRNLTYNPENKTVRFFCDIVGQPIPNITWYRNDMPIKRDDLSGRFHIKYELWGSIPIYHDKFSIIRCHSALSTGALFSLIICHRECVSMACQIVYLSLWSWVKVGQLTSDNPI